MKTGPCKCGAPDCSSCGPAQGATYYGKCLDCKADLYTGDDYWVDNMTDEVLCGDCRDRRIKTQPDLLEACEQLLEALRFTADRAFEVVLDEDGPLVTGAEAAIAKARGE